MLMAVRRASLIVLDLQSKVGFICGASIIKTSIICGFEFVYTRFINSLKLFFLILETHSDSRIVEQVVLEMPLRDDMEVHLRCVFN